MDKIVYELMPDPENRITEDDLIEYLAKHGIPTINPIIPYPRRCGNCKKYHKCLNRYGNGINVAQQENPPFDGNHVRINCNKFRPTYVKPLKHRLQDIALTIKIALLRLRNRVKK